MLEKLYRFANENNSNVVRFNYNEYNDYSRKFKKIDFAKKKNTIMIKTKKETINGF